jgi:superfamily I DNA and/or RNA helicase
MTQLSDTMRRACKVETVDSYQGKQNAIVFLSLVRNNDAGRVEGRGEAISEGFLAKPNRLNVAMSRARDRLVVFGSLNRWPEDGAMARISALVRGLADDGEAAVVNKF